MKQLKNTIMAIIVMISLVGTSIAFAKGQQVVRPKDMKLYCVWQHQVPDQTEKMSSSKTDV